MRERSWSLPVGRLVTRIFSDRCVMRKPITPFVHGIIDYMTAATFASLPRSMGWSRKVTTLFDAAGCLSLVYSLVTKYPLGVVKLMPMKTHLKIDALQGGTLLASSLLMDDEDDDARAAMAGLGVFCLGASMLTQTHDETRLRRSGHRRTADKSREGTMAAMEI